MAELTPLYMDIDNVYSGDELGLPWRDVVGEGIVADTDMEVTQKASGADLSVDVAAGAAWVLGDTNPDAQPIYRVRNDAVVNLGISPDPSNPRKVIVVAQITDETFAGTGRSWALTAIHGTPAGSPTEPALPDSALKLAVIDVPAAAASIVTADITDSRVLAGVGAGNLGGGGTPSSGGSVPSGAIMPFAGAAAPTDWLLCDGSAVDRTTYADLFTAIGTAYGAGDGSTTFNLPDLNGRAPVGKGANGDVNNLGESDGLADASRSPKHTHNVSVAGQGTNYSSQSGVQPAQPGTYTSTSNGPAFLVVNYIIKT